jgi:hypothetical protein
MKHNSENYLWNDDYHVSWMGETELTVRTLKKCQRIQIYQRNLLQYILQENVKLSNF